ncbi:MAG TPA: hypothetical protein VIM04_06985 [Candidatus Binatia bacterium]
MRATFQAVYGRLGGQKMVELTATTGYYAMLACTLEYFRSLHRHAAGRLEDLTRSG